VLVALMIAGFSAGRLLRSSPAHALDGGDECYRTQWGELVEVRRRDRPNDNSQQSLWRKHAALQGEGGGVSALLVFLDSPAEGGALRLEVRPEARP
jgi:hypothetical protein